MRLLLVNWQDIENPQAGGAEIHLHEIFGRLARGGHEITLYADDHAGPAHYNTVDASLWFIHACFEYARLSGDAETFESLLKPACRDIIDGYRREAERILASGRRQPLAARP